MSQQLVDRSADLKQLRDEGFDIEIKSSFLLVKDVPYVNARKEIKRGILVTELNLAGDITTIPNTHVVYFIGEYPCNRDGIEIGQLRHQSGNVILDKDIVVNHSFSNKPPAGYKNYYEKMTTYVAVISSPAASIDPNVTAKTFPVLETSREESVFNYIDTASSRAGISAITRKVELNKIGIVGLGGTGAYVLDLIAKTPVKEIHLYDGDMFSQHNAFESPSAPSVDQLRQKPQKVNYFRDLYSKMHRGIIPHDCYIQASNVDLLHEMDFIFLCLDTGEGKKLIVERLEEWGKHFIDVGMGIESENSSLLGILRVTASTPEKRVKGRIPFSASQRNEYSKNIQIADLNALSAALAVIKWKKLREFYLDIDKEHHSTYTIDGNMLTNEEKL